VSTKGDRRSIPAASAARTAKVLDFPSPTGDWWVRVRVLNDDRLRAEEITRETHPEEGSAFLVRLD